MSTETEGDTSLWGRTVREANEMASELRTDGWEVVVVRAGHAAPLSAEAGETDRSGLVYLAPDGVAESLPAIADRGEFGQSAAFRRRVGTDLFLVTRVSDPERRLAVLLVGAVDLSQPAAADLAAAARERGHLRSHVELLDGTHLATFGHDHPGDFLPEDL
ncbi:hypothetical protein C475_04766 [Halosimplex carlsbadense 2-9-1]|uniref:Uncharacterized protein n=1 Tax=Halosimplex carlsbadense 2-9-1 TaxID=797114 RepID=M0D087_9EURY|nr:hypothetical protein [Halosimplex carlsbadense]ELZ28921.1 hypothetical protein C475_04766 [Halosimplex carlsbadense 2-9-1]